MLILSSDISRDYCVFDGLKFRAALGRTSWGKLLLLTYNEQSAMRSTIRYIMLEIITTFCNIIIIIFKETEWCGHNCDSTQV